MPFSVSRSTPLLLARLLVHSNHTDSLWMFQRSSLFVVLDLMPVARSQVHLREHGCRRLEDVRSSSWLTILDALVGAFAGFSHVATKPLH